MADKDRISAAATPDQHDPAHEKVDASDADIALAAMGYKPVFKREFGLWSAFSFALSISGLYGTVMTTYSYPLYAGGAASAVWCWLIAGIGAMCLALSISEVASAYPTSGAMYFTIKYLAPEKYVPVIAWIDGWLNLIGQICGSASSSYGASQMLLAAVAIGSDFTYSPTQGHIIGVMAALSVFHALVNCLNTAWLSKIASTYAVIHIAVLFSCCVALLVLQKDKNTASYVFTEVNPDSGWNPPGFSFLFGFLSVAWVMTDYDAAAHIAEETRNPAITVPTAISSALGFTYVVGWLFTIVLAFCMGPLDLTSDDPSQNILASAIEQPVVQIYYNVMGKRAAIFFAVSAFIIMNFVCITALQAGSRTIWAFSRDEMLPGSRIWYKIWGRTDTPVLAVWLYTLICILINLIGLGSYITISAIFSLCAIALDWSYCIPILCKLLFNKFERGPWHLGPASFFVNVWACSWTAFVSIIFLFPTVRPVATDTMNYAVVILAFVLLFSLVYWFIAGRKYYVGPRTEAHVVDGMIIKEPTESELRDREKHVNTTEGVVDR
ncbi:hypothetical protein LA080_006577 [Diaporthe eres]|uniref:Amino acid permease n=1 Tax=Diaporthe vaccinii TaxID=105482 RepID=A0ABR4F5E1_9PEZI|nr:hypothetical protein LA080_006577 [Diaporthe eres]